MKIVLALAAAAALSLGCGSKCTPGDPSPFVSCATFTDGGNSCAPGPASYCVALNGGAAADTRCVKSCNGGLCPAGQDCVPTAIGSCGLHPDGGTCTSAFLCYPAVCP